MKNTTMKVIGVSLHDGSASPPATTPRPGVARGQTHRKSNKKGGGQHSGKIIANKSRKKSAPADPLIIGIDPGNESAGICIIYRGSVISSYTIGLWSDEPFEPEYDYYAAFPDLKCIVYVEEPQNGAHSSRAGVNRAAGMLIQISRSIFPGIKRKHVKFVKPREWREHHFGKTKIEDYKAVALEKTKHLNPASHDEAEAILIAQYGVYRELGI